MAALRGPARGAGEHLALPGGPERGHFATCAAAPAARPRPASAGPSCRSCPRPRPTGPTADDLAQLYRAIERLSDVEKAFVLLYLEERTYAEMADMLGITQNNVRVKMHRVQDKLRQLLTQPA